MLPQKRKILKSGPKTNSLRLFAKSQICFSIKFFLLCWRTSTTPYQVVWLFGGAVHLFEKTKWTECFSIFQCFEHLATETFSHIACFIMYLLSYNEEHLLYLTHIRFQGSGSTKTEEFYSFRISGFSWVFYNLERFPIFFQPGSGWSTVSTIIPTSSDDPFLFFFNSAWICSGVR